MFVEKLNLQGLHVVFFIQWQVNMKQNVTEQEFEKFQPVML